MRPIKDSRAKIKASLRERYLKNTPPQIKSKGGQILESAKIILKDYSCERAVLNIIWRDIVDFFNL